MCLEEIRFDYVQHLFHLTKNEDSMLRKGSIIVRDSVDELCLLGLGTNTVSAADATVEKYLSAKRLSDQSKYSKDGELTSKPKV